jgi:hypothetical protein
MFDSHISLIVIVLPSMPFNLSRNSSTEKDSFLRVRARAADAAAAASVGTESIVPGAGCWGEEMAPFEGWGVPGVCEVKEVREGRRRRREERERDVREGRRIGSGGKTGSTVRKSTEV